MAIRFACRCGQTITAPETSSGLKARCPRCGDQVRVPPSSGSRTDPLSSGSWITLVHRAKADRTKGPGGGRAGTTS